MTRRTASGGENGVVGRRRSPLMVSAVLGLVLLFLGLASFVGWVGTYLFPVLLIVGVVVLSFALLVWVAGKLDDRWYTLP